MNRPELVAKATRFLVNTEGKAMPNGVIPTQQMKMEFIIKEKGLTMEEYLEALNNASGGEVLRSALGGRA